MTAFQLPRHGFLGGKSLVVRHSAAVEWDAEIQGIADRYLQAKYRACDIDGNNCRALCDRTEVCMSPSR